MTGPAGPAANAPPSNDGLGPFLTTASVLAAAQRGAPPEAFDMSPDEALDCALVTAEALQDEVALLALLRAGAEPTVSPAARLLMKPELVRASLESGPASHYAWERAVNSAMLPEELPPESFVALFRAGWRGARFGQLALARQFTNHPEWGAGTVLDPSDQPLFDQVCRFAREVGAGEVADLMEAGVARSAAAVRLKARAGPRP